LGKLGGWGCSARHRTLPVHHLRNGYRGGGGDWASQGAGVLGTALHPVRCTTCSKDARGGGCVAGLAQVWEGAAGLRGM
jgi:hypothetical protein